MMLVEQARYHISRGVVELRPPAQAHLRQKQQFSSLQQRRQKQQQQQQHRLQYTRQRYYLQVRCCVAVVIMTTFLFMVHQRYDEAMTKFTTQVVALSYLFNHRCTRTDYRYIQGKSIKALRKNHRILPRERNRNYTPLTLILDESMDNSNIGTGNDYDVPSNSNNYKLNISALPDTNRLNRNMDNENGNNNNLMIDKKNQMQQYRSQRWILLVDDEAAIRDAVGQLLVNSGYQVTVCADGKEALRVALWSTRYGPPPSILRKKNRRSDCEIDDKNSAPSLSSISSISSTYSSGASASASATSNLSLVPPRDLPDVIVSDVRMPIMDGLTLLEQIRSHSQLVQIPVILLTAKGMVQDRVAGYQAGADAYLPKPFDPDELIALIDHFIQRHEILNDANQNAIVDLQRNVQDIKYLLLEQMGGGSINSVGKSDALQEGSISPRVINTNVFLAPDERQVLYLLCEGKMNKEIAETMYLSTRRIEQLLTVLFRKTKVKNRTELVRWAIATGNVKI
jgi:DNA-binding NarL/FixJ family response regulator